MAVIFMDGFDNYSSDNPADDIKSSGWAPWSSNSYLNVQTGTRFPGDPNPGKQIYNTDGTGMAQKYDLTATDSITVGWAFKCSVLSEVNTFAVYEGTTKVANLDYSSIGEIKIQDSAGLTQETSTAILKPAEWNYIEVSVFSNSSTGSVSVMVDGVPNVVTASNINTGTGNITGFLIDGFDNWYLDDVYVTDDLTPLVMPRIFALPANASGTTNTDWTGDYTYVDDPGGTADATIKSTYLESATEGDLEDIQFASLPTTETWNIEAVRPTLNCVNVSASAATIGYTTNDGATATGITTSSFYEMTQPVLMHANGTSGGWSEAQVNGLELTLEYETP